MNNLRIRMIGLLAAAPLLIALWPGAAHAEIYMKYGDIKGESTAEAHRGSDGWIGISSFQWGVEHKGTSAMGAGAGESSRANLSDLTLTLPQGPELPALIKASLSGMRAGEVKLDFSKIDRGQSETYMTVDLHNATISGLSISSGGDRPTVTITIHYGEIIFTSPGANANPSTIGWNVERGAPM